MDETAAFRPVIPLPEPRISPLAQRRRADLRLGHVLPALIAAPLFGSVLMATGIGLMDRFFFEDGSGVQWRHLSLALASPSLWSLASGLAYLQTVSRLRGEIARPECLLLGCASGFLMPFAMDLADALILHARLPSMSWNELKAYSIGGLLTLPFGLFGGWVFWRLGVRCAPEPVPDFAAVFD